MYSGEQKRWYKRFVIDFRKINKLIKTTAYPLPRIEDILASLNRAKYFTCLDLSNSYHQLPIKDKDLEKLIMMN